MKTERVCFTSRVVEDRHRCRSQGEMSEDSEASTSRSESALDHPCQTLAAPADLTSVMESLSEEERLQIAAVLQRDLQMRQKENQRVAHFRFSVNGGTKAKDRISQNYSAQKLTLAAYANDVENRNRRLAAKAGRQRTGGALMNQMERKCAICAGKLGYLKKQGILCEDCRNRICGECSRWWTTRSGRRVRLCRLCAMNREYTAQSGKVFHGRSASADKGARSGSAGEVFKGKWLIPPVDDTPPAPSETIYNSIKECTPDVEMTLAQLQAARSKRRQSLTGTFIQATFGQKTGGKLLDSISGDKRRSSLTSLGLDTASTTSMSPRGSVAGESTVSAANTKKNSLFAVSNRIRRRSCIDINTMNSSGAQSDTETIQKTKIKNKKSANRKFDKKPNKKRTNSARPSQQVSIRTESPTPPSSPTLNVDDLLEGLCIDADEDGANFWDDSQREFPLCPTKRRSHSSQSHLAGDNSEVVIRISNSDGDDLESSKLSPPKSASPQTRRQKRNDEKRRRSWTDVFSSRKERQKGTQKHESKSQSNRSSLTVPGEEEKNEEEPDEMKKEKQKKPSRLRRLSGAFMRGARSTTNVSCVGMGCKDNRQRDSLPDIEVNGIHTTHPQVGRKHLAGNEPGLGLPNSDSLRRLSAF